VKRATQHTAKIVIETIKTKKNGLERRVGTNPPATTVQCKNDSTEKPSVECSKEERFLWTTSHRVRIGQKCPWYFRSKEQQVPGPGSIASPSASKAKRSAACRNNQNASYNRLQPLLAVKEDSHPPMPPFLRADLSGLDNSAHLLGGFRCEYGAHAGRRPQLAAARPADNDQIEPLEKSTMSGPAHELNIVCSFAKVGGVIVLNPHNPAAYQPLRINIG